MFKITSVDPTLICSRAFSHGDRYENSNQLKKEAKIFLESDDKIKKINFLKRSKRFKIITDILRERI